PVLGCLVGRVRQAPDTGMSYVVAHGVVRVPQVIAQGATEQLVGDTLAAAQRLLPPEHGVVVGWYRSDPTGQHMISPDDHRAHVRHFQRPWQFALVVNIRPAGTRGGFFRPTGDPGSRVVYLPFYELLDERQVHHARADRKSTRLNSSHLGISYAVFCLKKKN